MACNGDCGNCSTVHTTIAGPDGCNFITQSEKDIYEAATFKSTIREEYGHLAKPTSAVVSLTDSCNNVCPYCFVDFNPRRMKFETAVQTVEFLKKNCQPGQKPTFCFFGGEPLLEYDSIIVPLVEKYGNSVTWSITTNGVALTEERIDFLADHGVEILLSMDGTKEIQDSQRPLRGGGSSYDKIMENFHYLLLRYPELCVRSTITKNSIDNIFEFMLFLERFGVKHCTFCINEFDTYDEGDYIKLRKQFEKCGHHIYKALVSDQVPIHFDGLISAYESLCLQDLEARFDNTPNRCGMGTTSIGVSPDGTINPCQEENSTKKYQIGNVYDGIDVEKHISYLEHYMDIMNNLHCDYFCPPNLRMFCFNAQCPNGIIRNNGKISSGKCIFSKAIRAVAVKLKMLVGQNIRPAVREYLKEATIYG